ncbi:class I SAM-dependent methyltransferase [Candidatus Kaiserbacteria bacterium]|nr:class I SAM-dependent methyltransferase [Candidatus Kaiserbacteria bacterium]
MLAPMDTISSVVHPRTDCRLCGSADLTQIMDFGQTPLANAYLSSKELDQPEVFASLVVNFCNNCKLVQLRDVVDPKVLFSRYLYVSGTSPVFVAHFADYAKSVTKRFQLSGDSLVIDVGSNDGVLLTQFKKEGTKILGVDPAENIAAEATQSGIPTLAKFFTPETATGVEAEYGKASVITANNVFAHTDDVIGFVEAVKVLMAKDGAFIFEVQYLKDLVEQNLFDIIYHEHLLYYHITPLIPFFKSKGLRVFDVEHIPTHGGSIRVYVGWDDGPHATSTHVEEMCKGESDLNAVHTYEAFMTRIASGKEKLVAMIADIRDQGKRIVGFGAPAKATTLCYAYGIDATMLEYIVDDSPLKQGLYMPGTHILIKPSSALYEDKPDYCVILAWNFAVPIVKNHQKFIENGGIFISPVPEPHILS